MAKKPTPRERDVAAAERTAAAAELSALATARTPIKVAIIGAAAIIAASVIQTSPRWFKEAGSTFTQFERGRSERERHERKSPGMRKGQVKKLAKPVEKLWQ